MMLPSPDPENRERGVALQPGKGTRLTASALGYLLSFNGRGTSFAHPWKPSLSGFGIRLARGFVLDMQGGQGIEPRIDGVKIGGEPGRPQPVLQIRAGAANAEGESWVCLEVEPDADGALTPETVRIVHAPHPTNSGLVNVGRHPLAIVIWAGGRPRLCSAIAHFHLRYLRVQPPAGGGNTRHFFL